MQELTSRMCNVDATDGRKRTPLHRAAAKGNTEAAVELIKLGASKDIVAGTLGTPLHQAAVGGHLTTLRALLKHGCSLDTLATDGSTVLHHAASGGNAAVIQELISRKCDVDATDEDNCTPLHCAAAKGNTEAAVELIKHGASKDIVAGTLGTPLHQGAVCGHLTTVRALLEHGCSLDTLATNGRTVLHHAAVCGNVAVIQNLISRKCDVDATDEKNWTPLHSAAATGNTEAVLELIKHGASKDIVAGPLGTPLHQAAVCGHLTTLRALLEHGCSLDTLATNGRTVLHHAASGGNVAAIQNLISRKCNVDATDEKNWTPLHSAAATGNTEAVLELIKHGASKDIVAGTLGTPLHQAAVCGHLTTVRALLEHGCSLDTLATNGRTVLHHAAVGGNVAVIQNLISRKCNVDATDEKNWTPLHSAAATGNTEAVLELIKHGASKDIVAGTLGTPLHQAAVVGHLTTLRALLEHGCSLDTLATNGRTVLHHAASGGNVAVIQNLISRKCNVDATDEKNWTPLHSAAAKDETEAVLELIKHGAFKDIVAGPLGTPLHQAAVGGHLTTLRALLERGCSLDTLATNGGTVLHHAAVGGNVAVIHELINRKCDVHAADERNWTPLHCAAAHDRTEAALKLINCGANLFSVAGIYGTPFSLACLNGHMGVVKALLECTPAVLHERNSIHGNPLHAAAQGNNPEILGFLISHSLQYSSTDLYGLSPLHYAAGFGRIESYQLLVENGANEHYEPPGFMTPLMFAHLMGNKRITGQFQIEMQELKSVSLSDAFGASSLDYFFALNLSQETTNDNYSKSEAYLKLLELLQENLSSINIHNIIAIGALLGADQLVDAINSFIGENPLLTRAANTTKCTISINCLKWMFQLDDDDPIVSATSIPGKTLSPIHLAMISKRVHYRRSHPIFHRRFQTYPQFIDKVLSSPLLHQMYCSQQSRNWSVHPMFLADCFQLHSITDILHKAGLEQIHLPLETISPVIKISSRPVDTGRQIHLSAITPFKDLEYNRNFFEQMPQANQIVKHIVKKVQHKYSNDDLENFALCLGIRSEANVMSLKKILLYWLDNSEEATWNRLLEALNGFETVNTMKTIRKELHEDLQKVKVSHSSISLQSQPNLPQYCYPASSRLDSSLIRQPVIETSQYSASSYSVVSFPGSSCNPYGSSTPQPFTLLTAPNMEKLDVVVLHEVLSEWYNFGLYLGMEASILDGIQASRLPPHGYCAEVVKHWLQYICGSGKKRRSWNTVLVAVTKVLGIFHTKRIMQKLGLQSAELTYDEFTHTRFTDLNSVPELVLLVEFVVDRVKHKFRAFALSLGVPHSEIDSIRQDYPSNLAHCCRETLKYWLSGKGGIDAHKPRTWQTVLEAVSSSVGPEVSKDIRKDLLPG